MQSEDISPCDLGLQSIQDLERQDGIVRQNRPTRTAQVGNVHSIVRETRTEAIRSGAELIAARQQVQAAQTRIRELEAALAEVARFACQDQLTGSLNRRGLLDVLECESGGSCGLIQWQPAPSRSGMGGREPQASCKTSAESRNKAPESPHDALGDFGASCQIWSIRSS
jgi:hypothetical protein